jgi:hypothetical protein
VIIIPMSGGSSRFFSAGFNRPKYELELGDKTLFWHALSGFSAFFSEEAFVFITRKDFNARAFVKSQCGLLGIKDYLVVELDAPTRGQAESVYLGTRGVLGASDSMVIFNIDTIRLDFNHPAYVDDVDGYLEVFQGAGDGWSFARVAADNPERVLETSEKIRISDYCSTGLYYFKTHGMFLSAFESALFDVDDFVRKWRELYVAPLYNYLIAQGADIRCNLIERRDVIFSGTPDEYKSALDEWERR